MPHASLAIDCDRLVDPGRFGAALHRARLASAESLTGLSRTIEGRWLPDQLMTIERGRSDLSDREMSELVELYGLRPQPAWRCAEVDLVLDRSAVSDITVPSRAIASDRVDWLSDLARRFTALAMFVGLDMVSGPFNITALAAAMETSIGRATEIVLRELEDSPELIVETVTQIEDRLVISECGILIGTSPTGALLLTQRIGVGGPGSEGAGAIGAACRLSEAVAATGVAPKQR